ncbi:MULTISPECIES: LacI family DNA-binding transcriptional regulator [unclassified Streptomyces]|uniref:LacI family DNA-binding transcriptional regulator n=1 Tax=unclassified Streptomyces TaxID=2593676 RepID=UPI0037F5849B
MARVARVSVSTVSRVVNGERYVGRATKERVENAIAQMGFQPNDIARTLRPGRTSATLGLVVEDLGNPFSAAVADGVDEVARDRGFVVLLGSTRRDFAREQEVLQEMARRRVDGLLVMPRPEDHTHIERDLAGRCPMVFLDRRPKGVEADAVTLDNRGGARRAVAEMLERGHRRIGYIGGAAGVTTGAHRLAGYRAALREHGVTPDTSLIRLSNHDTQDAQEAAASLLAGAHPPTALFADNNRMTVGAALAVHRYRSPVDLTGFDPLELAELLHVPLTLVTYDARALGRIAAELLFRRMDGDEAKPRRITLPTELTRFGSTDHA